MNHQEAQRILSSSQPISDTLQHALDAHLATCRACREFAALTAQLHEGTWQPYRKQPLSIAEQRDLAAKLTPQIRRQPVFKKSPLTTLATAVALIAIITTATLYVLLPNNNLPAQANPTVLPIASDDNVTALPTAPIQARTLTPMQLALSPSPPVVSNATRTPAPTEANLPTTMPLSSTTEPTPLPLPTLSNEPEPQELPKESANERRRAQLSSETWVATLVDAVEEGTFSATHTVTLERFDGTASYVVYNAQENLGLGGLWVDLLHFSADNRYFYFAPGTASHNHCQVFDGSSTIFRVDLSDGSTVDLQTLIGSGHTFDGFGRVSFIIGGNVVVYDLNANQSNRYPIDSGVGATATVEISREYGGLVWKDFSTTELVLMEATSLCDSFPTSFSLWKIDTETGESLRLAQSEGLGAYRPKAWKGNDIFLTRQSDSATLIYNLESGQFLLDGEPIEP